MRAPRGLTVPSGGQQGQGVTLAPADVLVGNSTLTGGFPVTDQKVPLHAGTWHVDAVRGPVDIGHQRPRDKLDHPPETEAFVGVGFDSKGCLLSCGQGMFTPYCRRLTDRIGMRFFKVSY